MRFSSDQGCGEEKKMGGCKRNFFKILVCIEKFFGREGGIYKTFKVGGVQNLIFPSDDLFFK
jgi:hypothetical protein